MSERVHSRSGTIVNTGTRTSWDARTGGILSRLVFRLRRSMKARYRLARRKFRATKRRVVIRLLLFTLKARYQVLMKGRIALAFCGRWLATMAGLFLAAVFIVTLPQNMLASLKVSEVHLASAGIIGTALALVLSLSIVPAQKAADVFSSAILRLYARDRTTVGVFTLLSCAALISLLFGTGWTLSVSPRYSLAGQLVLLGLSLDALRVFYNRALNLLEPATALSLVSRECERHLRRISNEIERLVRVQQIMSAGGGDGAITRYALHSRSNLSAALNEWTTQLEEFAHKGIARRDTQAVTAIVRTMAHIGEKYSDVRRDSIFLLPDFSGGMPIGVSDIGTVLDPIYESIKRICEDAAKQSNESVVQGCFETLGNMAVHAMTMVHTSDLRCTAPLAFSPVFYIGLCAKAAIPVGMEDALLTSIEGTRKVFAKISTDTDTRSAEAQALDVLFTIAVSSYQRQASASCFRSVEMMLRAAQHDIRVRGYRDVQSLLRSVLPNIAALMPLEVAMEKAGQRMMQTFPPYSLGFEVNIPMLLSEIANQVKPGEDGRAWINPFANFNKASEVIVLHYREVADKVNFDGVLLEKWVVDSIIKAAEVHIHLLDNPPSGAERFVNTVDDRLRWFLYAPAYFFREDAGFPFYHASEACRDLAVLGMALLQRGKLKSAEACSKAIRSIAHNSAKAQSSRSYTSHFGFADCVVKLELLARAADALGCSTAATTFRLHASRPMGIPDEEWPEYAEAVATRTRQMEDELRECGRDFHLEANPVAALRDILRQQSGARPVA